MAFQQATIKIEREQEYRQLCGAVERAVTPLGAAEFLKQVAKAGLKVRQFERVLSARVLEKADRELAQSGSSAEQLWNALPVSDQCQAREFYLERIEQVDPSLRAKYRKVYMDLPGQD
jgi:hypothetical protein